MSVCVCFEKPCFVVCLNFERTTNGSGKRNRSWLMEQSIDKGLSRASPVAVACRDRQLLNCCSPCSDHHQEETQLASARVDTTSWQAKMDAAAWLP